MGENCVKHALMIGAAFLVLASVFVGCSNYQIPGKGGDGTIKANSCEGCHTDLERLIDLHDPDTEFPEGGCGGAGS